MQRNVDFVVNYDPKMHAEQIFKQRLNSDAKLIQVAYNKQ